MLYIICKNTLILSFFTRHRDRIVYFTNRYCKFSTTSRLNLCVFTFGIKSTDAWLTKGDEGTVS